MAEATGSMSIPATMKRTVKRFIPRVLFDLYVRLRWPDKKATRSEIQGEDHRKYRDYDIGQILKHSSCVHENDTPEKVLAQIVILYHTVEKGLTMGAVRLGFGAEKVKSLIGLCNLFIQTQGTDNEMLREAVGVISEYDSLHKSFHHPMERELQADIDRIISIANLNYLTSQPDLSRETYFQHSNSPFDAFSKSRHSLRDFDPRAGIAMEKIEQAVALAQYAPSTCNRQSVRIHVIANANLLKQVLALQTGNRGFGDRADKLILIASDLQCWGKANERHGPYMDMGIYAMNLLYALHFNQVGACPLNWYPEIPNDIKLREIAAIPPNEVVGVIIACGALRDEFKVAKSKRKDYKSVLRVHS